MVLCYRQGIISLTFSFYLFIFFEEKDIYVQRA